MIYKNKNLLLLILLFVLTGLCLNSGCTSTNSNQSNSESECAETQADPSSTSSISPSSNNNITEESFITVFEGDLQNIILSLVENQGDLNETKNDDISSAFVNEEDHLFIELSDHSIIDVGLVRDTNDTHDIDSEKQYTVDFYDYDGVLICSRQVNEGEMAIAPKNPVRDGFSFAGWDQSFSSVYSDLEVTAQYEPLPSLPQIIVNNAVAISGTGCIEVELAVDNNPGILGMTLQLEYDSRYFSLINAANGDALQTLAFTKPGRFESPCKFTWDGIEVNNSDICDGIILNLTFELSNDIPQGVYPVRISYEEDGIIDRDLAPVDVKIEQGNIIIVR